MKYCRYCGKQIDDDSTFCTFCGKSQIANNIKEQSHTTHQYTFLNYIYKIKKNFFKFLKNDKVRRIIKILLYLIVILFSSISLSIAFEYLIQTEDTVARYFSMDLLISGTLAFFSVLSILLSYKKIRYIYIYAIVTVFLYAGYIYSLINYAKYEANTSSNTIIEDNRVINRTFCGISFGDSYSDCFEILEKYADENNIEDRSLTLDSIKGLTSYTLNNLNYGKLRLDTLKCYFYNRKFYQIRMIVNIDYTDQENNWTYNSIKDIVNQKYYSLERRTDYNNTQEYSDSHTEIELWHSFKFDAPHQVRITYYDLDSGFREERDKGF